MSETAHEYISRVSSNRDRIMVLGIIENFETKPPVHFYLTQLTRATQLYVAGSIIDSTIRDTHRLGMLSEVCKLPPKRIIYEKADHLGWSLVRNVVEASGIIIPSIDIDPSDTYRVHTKPKTLPIRANAR